MSILEINGGKSLFGEVIISGSKNSSLPIICASLLTEEEVILNNVPDLIDVNILLDSIKKAGCIFEKTKDSELKICSKNLKNINFMNEVLSEMRASILLLGSCVARFGEVSVSFPGDSLK